LWDGRVGNFAGAIFWKDISTDPLEEILNEGKKKALKLKIKNIEWQKRFI
jgi:hypothetical protein